MTKGRSLTRRILVRMLIHCSTSSHLNCVIRFRLTRQLRSTDTRTSKQPTPGIVFRISILSNYTDLREWVFECSCQCSVYLVSTTDGASTYRTLQPEKLFLVLSDQSSCSRSGSSSSLAGQIGQERPFFRSQKILCHPLDISR